jgi:hypothetical protein
MSLSLLLVAILAAADATPAGAAVPAVGAGPDVLGLEVDLVRITPHRPGTDQNWVIPASKRKSNDGGLCTTIVTIGVGAATSGAGGLLAHSAIKSLCSEVTAGPGAPAQARMETAPDIYLRLTGGREVLRSYTVTRTLSNTFKWRAVVPVAAIPKTGLREK